MKDNDIKFDTLRPHHRQEVMRMMEKGATRRDILGWFGAAGMTAAIAGPLAMGATRAYADTPKTGGHLKFAGYAQSAKDTLDPTKFTYSNDFLRAYTNYDTLVELDSSMNPSPRLATEWEATNSAQRWVIDLRKGVTFHNGKTFTSADAAWSLLRHKDEEVASTGKALMDAVTSITTDGPNRIVIELDGPNADFIRTLGLYNFAIVPENTTDFTTGIGTGPFVIKEFRPGISTSYERNKDYFGNAYINTIEQFSITDNVARANAVISGEADIVLELDGNSLQAVANSGTAAVWNTPGPAWKTLVMQTDKAPFDNKDLRNAIKYMFDRERLIKTTFKGYAVKANDHPFHPSSPYYNADLPQRELDLDRAKSLIKKAGMDGETIELHVSDASGGSVDMGLMLQQSALKTGLKVDIKREPADGYWSNIWLKRGFFGSDWNPRPVYDVVMQLVFVSGGKWNESHFSNERLDSLVKEARGTVDEAKRTEMYKEVQAILYEEDGHMTPAFSDFLDGVGNRVKGMVKIPLGNACGFNFANKIWLEDA